MSSNDCPQIYIISVAPAPGDMCCFGTFNHHRDFSGSVILQFGGREGDAESLRFFVIAILGSVWESCGGKKTK